MYPGLTLYNEVASSRVVHSAASHVLSRVALFFMFSVDLYKLHFVQPRPGSTGIKVSGEALTMKGNGNLDLWSHCRYESVEIRLVLEMTKSFD